MEEVLKRAKQDMMLKLCNCVCTDTVCCGRWASVQLESGEYRYSVAQERYVFTGRAVTRNRTVIKNHGTTVPPTQEKP